MNQKVPTSRDLALSSLDLDASNPRFGDPVGGNQSQRWVLDKIVEEFGVDDLLSSMSVNGYFSAEPIVVREKDGGRYVVVEGNRRLAACLMLTGDARADNQKNRALKYVEVWKEHNSPQLDPIPAIVFAPGAIQKNLLSYLGVRHIASSKSWDSYAKAAWVARVIKENQLTVREVASMIGDQHRTIERLLQGYHVIQQLIASGDFRPEDSVRRGRGSVSDYPFSWVYTILGYSAARKYLGIEGQDDVTDAEPIQKPNLSKGGVLVRAMFGDAKAGRNAAVTDSRQLGTLASVLVNPEKLALLEQGKSVDEIERISQPTEDQLRSGLAGSRDTLSQLIARVEESPLAPAVASTFVDSAGRVRNLASALEQRIKGMAGV
ncbi:ParB N-terminal domain-containing protein [Lysobacter sp. ESA13C]|uniref:ParB N-terminal domain-containing protein n=1 Tax=Lysobacter sp. ESA13C TaxID=2862676 RepID=UPI001CBEF456|nr:ParB N-terminal domain-containing protein [Lysobacter sp. ESA13C]